MNISFCQLKIAFTTIIYYNYIIGSDFLMLNIAWFSYNLFYRELLLEREIKNPRIYGVITAKYSFSLFIFFALFSVSLFSQETKDYKQSGPIVDYNYYGVPFFINIGYMNRENSSQLFFPLVGISVEPGNNSFNIFANAKMEYRYRRFYLQVGFKQALVPYYGNSYKYEYLESYGEFSIGYFFKNTDIYYSLDVGNMYTLDFSRDIINKFQVNHSVEISSLLYVDAVNTLSLKTYGNIYTIPYSQQYSYSFSTELPYTFYHYWGEFGIMPFIEYSQYFKNSKREYAIGDDYLGSIRMIAIAGNMKSHDILYNFISAIHLEYKFYLRFLPAAFRSIYLVCFGDIGYGKEINQTFNEGRMLYVAGGGIGYSLFGVAPLQITFGIDQSSNIVINFAVSTILHKGSTFRNFKRIK